MGNDHAKRMAELLQAHPGPFVVVAHVDPDGDAVGSVLTLARALRRLGREVFAPMAEPPRYLRFLLQPGELQAPMAAAPEGALVVVVDSDLERASGVPLVGATVINIDHHASNPGGGLAAWIDAGYASASVMVADVVDALGVPWDAQLATPALMGLMTDTGLFRFGNTNPAALQRAGTLMAAGVNYGELADRLQWRHFDHYRLLAMVLQSARVLLGGEVILAHLTLAMRAALGETEDDSDDFVHQFRYAEGTRLAAILKEREGAVKVSVRSRAGLSARRVCAALGGGGHEVAAGATLLGVSMAEAEARLLEAMRQEIARAMDASRA